MGHAALQRFRFQNGRCFILEKSKKAKEKKKAKPKEGQSQTNKLVGITICIS